MATQLRATYVSHYNTIITCIYPTYIILSTFTNMVQFHISQDTKLYQIIGPLIEPKQLAYRNMVPDRMFIS